MSCRFNPDTETPVVEVPLPNPLAILTTISLHAIKVSDVVSDRAFTYDEEASDIIQLLSSAAAELGMPNVISELGQAKAIGSQAPDPLENVPEATPVLRLKVSS
jgi:DNA-directed RNA polymerase, mitochondrial